jgi:hypothetical protein
MTIWTSINGFIANIFSMIINAAIRFGTQMIQRAISAATGFVNGLMGRIRSLPGRVYSALVSVVSRIVSAGQQWVSSAKQKALDLVNGAYNTLIGLPGKVADALNGVKDAIVKPFQDAYDQAKKLWDDITSLGGAFGGEDLPLGGAYGGEDLLFNNTTYTNGTLRVTNDVNLTLDLRNVPSNIDETTLKNALLEGLTDKEVLSILVNNNDFQSLDQRAKNRIMMRNNRARGV